MDTLDIDRFHDPGGGWGEVELEFEVEVDAWRANLVVDTFGRALKEY